MRQEGMQTVKVSRVGRGALRRGAVLATAVGAMLTAVTVPAGAAPPAAVRTAQPGGVACPGSITQRMDGAVSGCQRIGQVGPGAYHVTVQQILDAGPAQGPTSVGPAVRVRLSPPAGGPGSTVTLYGTVAQRPKGFEGDVNLCFGGCPDGLQYESVPAHWVSARTFAARFVVPAAPWIEQRPARVARLVSGSYPVGVQCVTIIGGCANGGEEGSAAFAMSVPSGAAPWCPSSSACADLTATPSGRPAQPVRIGGEAPLESVLGADQPFVYQAVISRGAATGPEVGFTRLNPQAIQADLGHAALRVRAAPPLPRAGALRVVTSEIDGAPPVSANPDDPSTVVWCGRGAVVVQSPSGTLRIPTTHVAAALAGTGLRLFPSACTVAALAGSGRSIVAAGGGGTVLAAFPTFHQSAPPVYQVAMETSDDGASWSLVPVPAGSRRTDFGGFTYRGDDVDALFAPSRGQVPEVEQSLDGTAWQGVPFACPAAGPCATFGTYVPGNCAMNGAGQDLLYRPAGGHAWRLPAFPPGLDDACFHAELAAVQDHRLILLDSGEPYRLLSSTDGGATWAALAVPTIPGFDADDPGFSLDGGLTVLPDGALLVTGARAATDRWLLLAPGAHRWCAVTGQPAATFSSSAEGSQVEVVGSQLWWLSGGRSARHVAVAGLHC